MSSLHTEEAIVLNESCRNPKSEQHFASAKDQSSVADTAEKEEQPALHAAKGICFSDIDGTLVHYEDHQLAEVDPDNLLLLPRSSTGLQGVISKNTLDKIAALRSAGIVFVLVSGARTTTIMARLPFLPASDAYVTENGGIIFHPDGKLQTALRWRTDKEWREQHTAVLGPSDQDGAAAMGRDGPLWDWARKLQSDGWKLDTQGYSTNFRVRPGPNRSAEQLDEVIAQAPAGIKCTYNLGVADFYPESSGKATAAQYLMKRFGAAAKDCVFLCDDDNDMELAGIVGQAFLPSITSASVRAAVKARPTQFVTSTHHGTKATEDILDKVAAHFGVQI